MAPTGRSDIFRPPPALPARGQAPSFTYEDLQTAKQLIELARRYLAKGEMAEAAHALAQAEAIVTEVAKGQAREDSQN